MGSRTLMKEQTTRAALGGGTDIAAACFFAHCHHLQRPGQVLQVDCPDLALARHMNFKELDEKSFLL